MKNTVNTKKIFSYQICLLVAGFFYLTPDLSAADTKVRFREGEILGPDAPLPVELVEDPALFPSFDRKRLSRQVTEKVDKPKRSEAAASQPLPSDADATTTLNVKDVEIATLVKSFSKIAKRNYVVDSNVKGKVTIHLAESVSTEEALRILDSVLLLKGFTTVPIGPNTYKVIQAKDAKKTTIPTVLGEEQDTQSDALVTRLLRLKNVPAADLQQALQPFVSGEGLLTTFAGTNSIIIIDSAANIERVEKIVKDLDVPALDQDVTVIPIKFAESKDIAEKINQILGQDEKSEVQSPTAVRSPVRIATQTTPGAPPQPQLDTSGAGRRSLPAKVIADERTNSIVVVADPETTAKIQALVERLDSKIDLKGGKFFVIRLKHADAGELSDVLNTVLGGGGGGSTGRRDSGLSGSSINRRSGLSGGGLGGGGFGGGSFGGGSFGGGGLSGSRGRMGRSSGGGLGGGGGGDGSTGTVGGFTVTPGQGGSSKVNFEGEVSVASDPSTNSIIVNASRNDFLKIQEVVDMLDIKRKQVLVESTILEVSLDTRESKGIELIGSLATDKAGVLGINNFGGLTDLLSNPAGLRDLTIAAASSGSITLPTGITIPSQALLINAVNQNQNVNVLSNPTILTTDNREAEIVVGQNIPIVTSRGTNAINLDNTFNNIDRQDVGITLRLTPQIGSADFVSLRIFVEISDVVEGTEANQNGPTTTVRTSETNVEVKSGQMVITGGLIQDSVSEADRGIPYWKDIPILGNLFSQSADRRRRTNLLIFITPRVVSDQFDAREVTAGKRDDLEQEIRLQESFPERSELLRSDNIDRVFERSSEVEVKPSTIIPAKKLSDSERNAVQESLKELHSKVQTPLEPYKLTVAPKLPEQVSQAGEFYVLLRKNQGEILALEIPGSLDGPAAKFFQTGSRVKRTDEKGKVEEFVCLGRYASKEQVEKSPLKAASWLKIPVPELLSLGNGPWSK